MMFGLELALDRCARGHLTTGMGERCDLLRVRIGTGQGSIRVETLGAGVTVRPLEARDLLGILRASGDVAKRVDGPARCDCCLSDAAASRGSSAGRCP